MWYENSCAVSATNNQSHRISIIPRHRSLSLILTFAEMPPRFGTFKFATLIDVPIPPIPRHSRLPRVGWSITLCLAWIVAFLTMKSRFVACGTPELTGGYNSKKQPTVTIYRVAPRRASVSFFCWRFYSGRSAEVFLQVHISSVQLGSLFRPNVRSLHFKRRKPLEILLIKSIVDNKYTKVTMAPGLLTLDPRGFGQNILYQRSFCNHTILAQCSCDVT